MTIRLTEGFRSGSLTVIGQTEEKHGLHRMVICRCDCGVVLPLVASEVKTGKRSSCGCSVRFRSRTHGHAINRRPSKTYATWQSMKYRCRTDPAYRDRGITVCERWMVFENFLADMGEKPAATKVRDITIERINNDLGYFPGNCRWATNLEQQHNTRSTRPIVWNGQRVMVSDLAKLTGVEYHTLRNRLFKQKMSVEDAISLPRRSGGRKQTKAVGKFSVQESGDRR